MPFCCGPSRSKISPKSIQVDKSLKEEINEKESGSTIIEKVVCSVDDLPAGTKREFDVNGTPIVVINDNGKYYGIAGRCPHLAGPMVSGFYRNKTIRCPAHGAKFSVVTGDIEDFPSFGCLPTYQVFERGSYLVVTIRESELSRKRIEPSIAEFTPETNNQDPIMVIGTGPAAMTFVETLRLLGNVEPIVMITREHQLPYDRTSLNKRIVKTSKEVRCHEEEWYKRVNVEVRTNCKVLSINTYLHSLSLTDSSSNQYSKLLIALGCVPRKLSVEGHRLANIFYLREFTDAQRIWERARGCHVVCIGGSFIGMEAASTVIDIAESVTVVCTTEEPLPSFGREVGAALRKYFERKNVRVITRGRLEKFQGSELGAVESVHLVDGETLYADCVIVGIGVRPNRDLIQTADIKMCSSGFALVDEGMSTSIDDVWAAGDGVVFPLPLWNQTNAHIEHFQVAQMHGKIAAYNLMGIGSLPTIVPFFWGRFFNELSIKFTGYADQHDSTIIHGDVGSLDYTKYYIQDDQVVAVQTAGTSTAAITFKEIFESGRKITRKQVESKQNDDWEDWLDK